MIANIKLRRDKVDLWMTIHGETLKANSGGQLGTNWPPNVLNGQLALMGKQCIVCVVPDIKSGCFVEPLWVFLSSIIPIVFVSSKF